MALFCDNCRNLLTTVTTADNFHYKCIKCEKIKYPDDKHTLIYSQESGMNLVMYQSILANAGKDPANPKVHRKCRQCNYDFARQVRLGSEMKLINTCMKCSEQWLDGTRDGDIPKDDDVKGGAKIKK